MNEELCINEKITNINCMIKLQKLFMENNNIITNKHVSGLTNLNKLYAHNSSKSYEKFKNIICRWYMCN